jgi:hypothetical protein
MFIFSKNMSVIDHKIERMSLHGETRYNKYKSGK